MISFLKGDQAIYCFVILAGALRVHNFSSASIWNDESFTLDIVHQNVSRIWAISTQDVNAPFYTLIVHFWCLLFGYSLPTVRFFSVLCSTLTTAVIYKASDKHFGRLSAIISSTWFCFSNIHIYYSEEARCYALLSFLVALSFYQFLELLRTPSTKALIWYSIFSLLALYTQFFVGLQIGIQALILVFIHRRNKKFVLQFLFSKVIIGGIFLVWFLKTFVFGNKVKVDTSWIPSISLYDIRLYWSDLANTEILFYVLASFYTIAMIGIIVVQRRKVSFSRDLLYVALVGILPFIIICLVSHFVISIFSLRYVMYTSIALIVSFGSLFAYIPYRKTIALIILTYMLFIMIPETRLGAFRSEEWDKACAIEQPFVKDSTCFLISPYYQEYCYIYYNMRWAYDEQYHAINGYYKNVKNLHNMDDSITFKQRNLTSFDRVIYYDGEPETNDKLPKYFKAHYDSVFQHNFYGITFYVFDKRKQKDTLRN